MCDFCKKDQLKPCTCGDLPKLNTALEDEIYYYCPKCVVSTDEAFFEYQAISNWNHQIEKSNYYEIECGCDFGCEKCEKCEGAGIIEVRR